MRNFYDHFVLKEYPRKFFTIFINKFIRVFTLKLNFARFRVADIVATRRVVTRSMWELPHAKHILKRCAQRKDLVQKCLVIGQHSPPTFGHLDMDHTRNKMLCFMF